MQKSKTKFIIRNLKPHDVKDKIKVLLLLNEELKKDLSFGSGRYKDKATIKERLKWFRYELGRIKKGIAITLVAEVNGKVIGFCNITEYEGGDMGHVCALGVAVTKEYRNMGIGTALMKNIMKRAKGHWKIITLTVVSVNYSAIKFYKRLGFKVFGILPGGIVREKRVFNDIYMYCKL